MDRSTSCFISLIACVALGITAAAAHAKPANAAANVTPTQLRGTWFQTDDFGRSQCKAWRKEDNLDNLIGAIVIHKNGYRTYAEYGEGNVATVHKVTKLGAASWKILDTTFLDGGDEGQTSSSIFSIKNAKLHWTFENTVNGKVEESTNEFFRCK